MVTNIALSPGIQSDHSFICLSLSAFQYWVWIQFTIPASLWEYFKFITRAFSMKYSKFKEEECSEKEAETIGSSEQDMYFRETSEILH